MSKNLSLFCISLIFSLAFFVSIDFVDARSGCCSHHGGVCGCRCCDGSSLSAKCAPYYPSCSSPAPTVKVETPPPTIPRPEPIVVETPEIKEEPKKEIIETPTIEAPNDNQEPIIADPIKSQQPIQIEKEITSEPEPVKPNQETTKAEPAEKSEPAQFNLFASIAQAFKNLFGWLFN